MFYKQHKITEEFPMSVETLLSYELEETKVKVSREKVQEILREDYKENEKLAYELLLKKGRIETKFSVIFYKKEVV